MNVFFDLQAYQFQEENQIRRKPRAYGDRFDPRQTMCDQEFNKHFRLSKDSVTRLCSLIEENLKFPTK